MTANAGQQLGAGWSSSQRVKKCGVKASIEGTFVQLENDSVACGTLVIHDAGASTTVFVSVADSAPGDGNTSVDLALGGSVYLHGIPPSRVYVGRSSGTNTVTVRYVTYV